MEEVNSTCPLGFTLDENTTVAIICTDGLSHYNISYHSLKQESSAIASSSTASANPSSSQPHRSSPPEYLRHGMPYMKDPDWSCDSLPLISKNSYPEFVPNYLSSSLSPLLTVPPGVSER
jgi:hypothetical protein